VLSDLKSSFYSNRFIVLFVACFAIKLDAKLLDCEYKFNDFVRPGNRISYCNARKLEITEPTEVITGLVKDYDYTGHIQGLNIEGERDGNGKVDYLPLGLGAIFENIDTIFLRKGFISLRKENLKQFPKLKYAAIQFCKLEVLEQDLFMYNPHIESISFASSHLKFVHPDVLKSLTKLTHANFGGNPCINFEAMKKEDVDDLSNRFLASCQDLKLARKHSKPIRKSAKPRTELDLVKSQNEDLTMRVLLLEEQVRKLIKLVGQEEDKSSVRLPRKQEINFNCKDYANNKCDVIDVFVSQPDATIGNIKNKKMNIKASEVIELAIRDQNLLFLPLNFGRLLSKLQKLAITNSRLVYLNKEALNELKELKQLDLSFNKLKEISADDFSGLASLEELDLSNNQISLIESFAFKKLRKLLKLNLNDNLLVLLDTNILPENVVLDKLLLGGNELQTIKMTSLSQFTSFDLSDNECIDLSYPANEPSLDTFRKEIIENCLPTICCEISMNIKNFRYDDFICR